LRDAFVAIFFTSIGMLFEPAVIAGEPALLAGMVGAVLFKGLLITAIVGLFWRSARLAVLTGFGLAQIGEFSFVLARQGGAAGALRRRLAPRGAGGDGGRAGARGGGGGGRPGGHAPDRLAAPADEPDGAHPGARAPRGRDRGAGAARSRRGHPVGVRDLDRAL